MSPLPKVTKIEVSSLFWRDLAEWRTHKEYFSVRARIAELVLRAGAGDPAGDVPFTGRKEVWDGIGHAHVGNKLTLFTTRPDGDTLRLCAVKKHDFYGFRSERKGRANDAARRIHNASVSPHDPSPGWSGLRWRDPSEVASHPELRELSDAGLRGLYQEILEEADRFDRLGQAVSGLSPRMRGAVEEAWVTSLIEAKDAVEAEILRSARPPRPHIEPAAFEGWGGPG
ncbi:hypothetical protein IQ03_01098 [Gemmobacter caeni]|uniref:Uncharacterized protein n=1 Tax=Gemmobacter caeni TaxID=589035 RepID=A0A2T6B8G1_9RHOB|nr:hypothetical protein [Gemmobacter caeni]PTX52308.1 hypothetical protein C8N34_10286 [Gemmobacter caeni]TWJ02681.1 hypothetical protein IQ03_01098 [Gemmobacter caeni]